MKKFLFAIAFVITAGLTLPSAGPVVGLQTPECAKSAQDKIDGLSSNLDLFLAWPSFNPYPPAPCIEPPADYDECMKEARDAFDDAISDAIADAIDAMSSALLDAQIKMAILEAQYNAATTPAERTAICVQMSMVGMDASDARWEAQGAFSDAFAQASVDLAKAQDDCCKGDKE